MDEEAMFKAIRYRINSLTRAIKALEKDNKGLMTTLIDMKARVDELESLREWINTSHKKGLLYGGD